MKTIPDSNSCLLGAPANFKQALIHDVVSQPQLSYSSQGYYAKLSALYSAGGTTGNLNLKKSFIK